MELELEQRRDDAAVSKLLKIRDQVQHLQRELSVVEATTFPAIDLIDTGEAYVLVADLPDVTAEALDIVMQDDVIQLSGHRGHHRQGKLLTRERQQGDFERVISLPEVVDVQATTAEFTQCVLTLTLPKLV